MAASAVLLGANDFQLLLSSCSEIAMRRDQLDSAILLKLAGVIPSHILTDPRSVTTCYIGGWYVTKAPRSHYIN